MAKEELIYIQTKDIEDPVPNSYISRREFVGGLFAGAVVSSIPFSSKAVITSKHILSINQLAIVRSIQRFLLPSDDDGPGAYEAMADTYLLWILSDERMDPEEKDYIINGIDWVDETAIEQFSTPYTSLAESKKIELIDTVSKEKWGKSWLGVILNFIFEALLSDPQYGGNPEEIGWQWLNHDAGSPRPKKELLYPEIIKTVTANR